MALAARFADRHDGERLLRKSRGPMLVARLEARSAYRGVMVPVDFFVHSARICWFFTPTLRPTRVICTPRMFQTRRSSNTPWRWFSPCCR